MTDWHRDMRHLLEKVYRERGFNFQEYRESTLIRRLGRRLRVRGAKTYGDYAAVLDKDPTEYDKLFDDLTINVTSFFRDQLVFKVLEKKVLPVLIKRETNKSKVLRIWSAGCASGEEPYSIAMLLLEFLGRGIGKQEVTILATDIDPKILKRARKGVFLPKEAESIRPAWLERYFVRDGEGLQIQPALKELITFRGHNLVSDSPYYDLDLVVCRNVLIYFTSPLQARVLKCFYEGLKKGGFLLLGKAEVPVGETQKLFRCVDKKAKLYRKN